MIFHVLAAGVRLDPLSLLIGLLGGYIAGMAAMAAIHTKGLTREKEPEK